MILGMMTAPVAGEGWRTSMAAGWNLKGDCRMGVLHRGGTPRIEAGVWKSLPGRRMIGVSAHLLVDWTQCYDWQGMDWAISPDLMVSYYRMFSGAMREGWYWRAGAGVTHVAGKKIEGGWGLIDDNIGWSALTSLGRKWPGGLCFEAGIHSRHNTEKRYEYNGSPASKWPLGDHWENGHYMVSLGKTF